MRDHACLFPSHAGGAGGPAGRVLTVVASSVWGYQVDPLGPPPEPHESLYPCGLQPWENRFPFGGMRDHACLARGSGPHGTEGVSGSSPLEIPILPECGGGGHVLAGLPSDGMDSSPISKRVEPLEAPRRARLCGARRAWSWRGFAGVCVACQAATGLGGALRPARTPPSIGMVVPVIQRAPSPA
jgi:hypothetical protein